MPPTSHCALSSGPAAGGVALFGIVPPRISWRTLRQARMISGSLDSTSLTCANISVTQLNTATMASITLSQSMVSTSPSASAEQAVAEEPIESRDAQSVWSLAQRLLNLCKVLQR